MKKMLLLFLLLGSHFCFAQFRNSIWCFGDSAGIDFNNINNPLPTYSLMDGRGTCVSIADSNGQLLFYASTRAGVSGGKSTIIRNYTGNIMQNGDSIVGGGWYHELLIIPMPNDVSKFYLFSVGVTSFYGLFYSIIDITADSGRGAITQKNIQVNNYSGVDAVAAVKHGNGRDWWLIFQKWDIPNNQFYKYLITPNGIIFNQVQAIGGIFSTNNANFTFFDNGSKILYTTFTGLVETMEFDRCTGLLYNEEIIEQEIIANPLKKYFGSVVSSNGSKIYLCSNSDTSYLIQFDLNAANIAGSKDTIFEFTNVLGEGGTLRLAPDHKIYLSNAWNDGVNYNYPYPTDSPSHNFINMNLSVINSPDSMGTACDFQPYSFYLGGKRTYWGLPNNPNYELPALDGSLCDTLGLWNQTNSSGIANNQSKFFVFYHPAWQTALIIAEGLSGKNYSLHIVDISGKEIFSENGSLALPSEAGGLYYTKDFHCEKLCSGVYMVLFETERERLVKRMVVE